MNAVAERLGDMGDRLRERRVSGKMEHLDQENQRLRTELSSLRSLLDEERADRDEILAALKGMPKTVVKKRRGGFMRTVVIGGGAYILGTRAGRARYEQIVAWAKRMRDRGRDATTELRGDIAEAADELSESSASSTGGFGSPGGGTTSPATTGPTTTAPVTRTQSTKGSTMPKSDRTS